MRKLIIWCVIALAFASIPAHAKNVTASWYGNKETGRLMANGERFNKHAMIAAHKSLPFGTKIKVTNRKNKKSVVVIVKDRGPYIRGRELDLSEDAAYKIGILHDGVKKVDMLVMKMGKD